MLGTMTVARVATVMFHCYYTVGGAIRKETDRGAISSDMMGEITRGYMLD